MQIFVFERQVIQGFEPFEMKRLFRRHLSSTSSTRIISVDRGGLIKSSPAPSTAAVQQAILQSTLRTGVGESTELSIKSPHGRDTLLGSLIRSSIMGRGPMSVADYMQLCLGHPQFGYYMRGDVFGSRGDFTTSPEVSQIFGELIGVWCVLALQDVEGNFSLVEGGPGRGTLTNAVLKVLSRFPSVHPRLRAVHLVETSPALRRIQAAAAAVVNQQHIISVMIATIIEYGDDWEEADIVFRSRSRPSRVPCRGCLLGSPCPPPQPPQNSRLVELAKGRDRRAQLAMAVKGQYLI
jgi:hypothetical protein